MQNQPNKEYKKTHSDGELSSQDFIYIVKGFIAYWPFLLGSLIVTTSIALIINKYSKNIYEISAKISVEESESPLGSLDGAVSIGFSFGGGHFPI